MKELQDRKPCRIQTKEELKQNTTDTNVKVIPGQNIHQQPEQDTTVMIAAVEAAHQHAQQDKAQL